MMIGQVPLVKTAVPGMVVIPARDEAATVGDVVRSVRRYTGWDVVVVDDVSVDDTAAQAKAAGADVLSLPFQFGAWGAVQTGLWYALCKGHRIVATLDADGQHTADSLGTLSALVATGVADIAIGVCPERISRARRLACGVFRKITGLNVRDVTSGLRVYNESAMRILASRNAAMLNYQDIGVLLMLREAGLHAVEVEVRMEERKYGRSRIYDSWWTVAGYLVETLALSIGKWRPSWHAESVFVTAGGGSERR